MIDASELSVLITHAADSEHTINDQPSLEVSGCVVLFVERFCRMTRGIAPSVAAGSLSPTYNQRKKSSRLVHPRPPTQLDCLHTYIRHLKGQASSPCRVSSSRRGRGSSSWALWRPLQECSARGCPLR